MTWRKWAYHTNRSGRQLKTNVKQTEGRGPWKGTKSQNTTSCAAFSQIVRLLLILTRRKNHKSVPGVGGGVVREKVCQCSNVRADHWKCSDWLVHPFLALFYQSIDRKGTTNLNIFSTELLDTNLTVLFKENIFLRMKEEKDHKQ